ncbi:uncharacterized protein cubi_02059 [Cryptosporidium ubiquitum]|uniref:Uncharacterized protein n=1 Tax=Cryptosporidium ubiquitum TaxID=857276 RepID=A0A1J4MMP9_9CRYT|nr:uncharacterized protein cubi_02059 [Cryptosporidium ubiquitum]OII75538.1 hypothetical protein cubi_02059 [Cryptosporidium ubiquitum]
MNSAKSLERILVFYLFLNIFLLNLSLVLSKKVVNFNNGNNTYSLKIIRRKLSRNSPENNKQNSAFSKSSNLILRKLMINEDGSTAIIKNDSENDFSLGNFTIVSESNLNVENPVNLENNTNENSMLAFSLEKSNTKVPKKPHKNNKTVTSVTTKITSSKTISSKTTSSKTTTSTSTTFTITNSTTITTTTNNNSTTQIKTETNNVRRVENKNNQGLSHFNNNETKKDLQVNEESITNDMAENKEDFTQIFNVIQDPDWITSNGDYYIIEFTEQNSTVPLVRLINLSVGLYNKNGNVKEAKQLISAILGSRNLGDPDYEEDFEENNNYFGSGLFNLDEIINWDDLDFMDEMPSFFRKLNNIIWL